MQIDFHHAVTYIVARLADFSHEEAQIVAYSAQYVDDATNDGYIEFDTGALYSRIASAHKMLDYKNFNDLANHHAWIPFHFLPGNNGLPAGQGDDLGFIQRIICKPNSYVARDMVAECIQRKTDRNALHRLGITMHVYADTWAHQGFVGVEDAINRASQLTSKHAEHTSDSMGDSIKDYFSHLFDHAKGEFVAGALPLGHGAVLSYPDRPYLNWAYTNGAGEVVNRDNPKDFLEAADHMCIAMKSFRAGDASLSATGLTPEDKDKIDKLIRGTINEDGDIRHATWLKAIRKAHFSFGKIDLTYVPKGLNSWKHAALGTTEAKDTGNEDFIYNPNFLDSDWKKFHDALQMHRLYVVQELLPKYGICAA
ncbi:hypothetical protein H8L32_12245 [Undibacterium sp. CY18W]|uniref:Uncharacterized protein n=1 Tax=Undibacterium hunanense TaxID=2762292 RepID=A0ABR6ZQT1_9BURK|nr:DUF6765 family protein [Undibacterium hunanense]MBC3918252.1 hypothetical protein [Undibacterium hunanense]